MSPNWQFFIDVGGTFTDVVARRPRGELVTFKLLSSARLRGVAEAGSTPSCIVDRARCADPDSFWVGYSVQLLERGGVGAVTSRVLDFDRKRGVFTLEPGLTAVTPGVAYELFSHEEAPVLAIRYLMGLGLHDSIGPIDVRLGTTRATNALLERKGAKVALVTTKGFADVLKIGYQDRPSLFELNIRKRDELACRVIEIDERLSAKGAVLKAPDKAQVRRQLEDARRDGIETPAICLLHSHVNPAHEEVVEVIAHDVGFEHVSVSSRVCRMERIVPRGDTAVVDAYLRGVIRDYVASLQRSLPEARLQLMTSTGGLVGAGGASGKDTILSGPAGGVVGCAHVASQAGFDRAIGFDMGGTSTDVSRIEPAREGATGLPTDCGTGFPTDCGTGFPTGRFEYQYETVKAGVRIMAPMLAVETVAAGGGSICAFDGQKLTVGPHSAGADPGPACYGRGGPLTVTDINLYLGRLVPEHFPFRLDSKVVGRKLEQLCGEVNRVSGSALDPIGVAEGFVQIANSNMSAAIKRISLAKGYDLREYTLVSFGGAGGQHACAIARMLGMSRVLLSPFAGVLSALGIGVADVKRISQRSVSFILDARANPRLDPVFRSITQELQEAFLDEGSDPTQLRGAVRSVDLCYTGQSTVIPVPADPLDYAGKRFEKMHRQLYGYCHEGRSIEVRAVRVELTAAPKTETRSPPSGGTETQPSRSEGTGTRPPRSEGTETRPLGSVPIPTATHTTEMVVDGKRRSVPVHFGGQYPAPSGDRERASLLGGGSRLFGPAIVIEETSTVVVEPGWEATVNETGDIVLTDVEAAPVRETLSTEVDPIQLELFNNQFAAIADQMGTTLRRTALSTNVKERLDFSCAIFTPAGDLVVNAPHIPVHLGAMSDCVKALIEDVGQPPPGSVYVTNDPYRGGSHLNDVTVITPIHEETQKRRNAETSKRQDVETSKCRNAETSKRQKAEPRALARANAPTGSRAPARVESPLPCDAQSATRNTQGKRQEARGKREEATSAIPGRLLFFVASRAHHAEIGGTRPGSMPPDSTSLAEEGVVIRAFPWINERRPQHEKLRELLTAPPYPSRTPEENLADVAAQAAANQTGVRELKSMIKRYGVDVVHGYMQHIQTAAGQKMRRALFRIPDGVLHFEDFLDDGTAIRLAVTIEGDQAALDFAGTGEVLAGNLNANRAIVTSAVLYCLRCLIDEDIPLNAGVLEPVKIILPQCLLNPPGYADPRRCPAVVGGNVETSQRVVDCIFGAFQTAAASQGTMNNVLLGNESFGYYETICGGAGAGCGYDGADAVHTHMTNTRLTDPEVLESRYPVRLVRFTIRRGSGGEGRYRGGCGVIRELQFLEPLDVSILSQRRSIAPYGLCGGGEGLPGRNLLCRKGSADIELLPSIAHRQVQSGDRLIVETPGGGGYGVME